MPHFISQLYLLAGFLQLLSQLTSVGDVSEEQFLSKLSIFPQFSFFERFETFCFNFNYLSFSERFDAMQACPNTYYVTVIEDTTNGQVIGSSTLVVEQKFIHGCAVVSRRLKINYNCWNFLRVRNFKYFPSQIIYCVAAWQTWGCCGEQHLPGKATWQIVSLNWREN